MADHFFRYVRPDLKEVVHNLLRSQHRHARHKCANCAGQPLLLALGELPAVRIDIHAQARCHTHQDDEQQVEKPLRLFMDDILVMTY